MSSAFRRRTFTCNLQLFASCFVRVFLRRISCSYDGFALTGWLSAHASIRLLAVGVDIVSKFVGFGTRQCNCDSSLWLCLHANIETISFIDALHDAASHGDEGCETWTLSSTRRRDSRCAISREAIRRSTFLANNQTICWTTLVQSRT